MIIQKINQLRTERRIKRAVMAAVNEAFNDQWQLKDCGIEYSGLTFGVYMEDQFMFLYMTTKNGQSIKPEQVAGCNIDFYNTKRIVDRFVDQILKQWIIEEEKDHE